MRINSYCNSGSSDSAAVASGTHRSMVSAGHPTSLLFYHPGDRADAEVLCVLWRHKALRSYFDSCGSGENASLLTSVFTFIKYVPKQHRRKLIFHLSPHPRGLAGRHMQASSPRLHSDSCPPCSTKAFFLD